ncbi:MAG: Lin1244/Lin1753 domain-containing protein [Prevotella sp.]
MGRQRKQGLKYCHLDVDFLQDVKVRRLIRHHGAAASAVYMAAICQVFTRGYFAQAHGIAYIVAESLNLEESYVTDVFNTAAELQLFDNNLYRNEGIITSMSIQRRYLEQCKAMRRSIDTQSMPYRLFEQSENSTTVQKSKLALQQDIFSSEEMFFSSEEKTDSQDFFRKNQDNYGKNSISSVKKPISSEEKNFFAPNSDNPEKNQKIISSEEKNISSEEKTKKEIVNTSDNSLDDNGLNTTKGDNPPISSEEKNISSEEKQLKNISSEEKNISSEEKIEEIKQKKEKEPKRNKEKNKEDKKKNKKTREETSAPPDGVYAEGVAPLGEDDWHEHNYHRFLLSFNSYLKAYNSTIKPVQNLTDARRSKLDKVFKYPRDKINILLLKIAKSPFLNARDRRLTKPADFDWIMREDNVVKALEGAFD